MQTILAILDHFYGIHGFSAPSEKKTAIHLPFRIVVEYLLIHDIF